MIGAAPNQSRVMRGEINASLAHIANGGPNNAYVLLTMALEEIGRTLLVGCVQEAEHDARFLPVWKKYGKAPSAWSFSLTMEQQAALRAWPYLYVYTKAPMKRLTHRLHVADFKTNYSESPCPWADLAENELEPQRTKLVDRKPIKTWFRIDKLEPLMPTIDLSKLQTKAGKRAWPGALQSAFGLWRLRA